MKKSNKNRKGLGFKKHQHNHVKTHLSICVNTQIFQLIEGGID